MALLRLRALRLLLALAAGRGQLEVPAAVGELLVDVDADGLARADGDSVTSVARSAQSGGVWPSKHQVLASV